MGAMIRRELLAGKGFTMIELVVIILLLGIVSAVAIVRVMDTNTTDLVSQVEVIKNHLRYAQSRAMSTGNEWGVTFATDKTYFLFDGAAPSTPVLFVGEENVTIDLDAKKSALTISSTPLTVTFDAYGSPGTATITIATNGGNIIVTKNTGYIP